MKRMKLFLHLAHLNHMFLKSVTKTGRDPPSECKKNIFCEGFPYILRFWRCLQEIQVFSCHTTNEVWMHLLARDEGVLGPGDSWCRGWPLSSVSHRCIPCCSGHWPALGQHPADHWTWNVGSSALYWFWYGLSRRAVWLVLADLPALLVWRKFKVGCECETGLGLPTGPHVPCAKSDD